MRRRTKKPTKPKRTLTQSQSRPAIDLKSIIARCVIPTQANSSNSPSPSNTSKSFQNDQNSASNAFTEQRFQQPMPTPHFHQDFSRTQSLYQRYLIQKREHSAKNSLSPFKLSDMEEQSSGNEEDISDRKYTGYFNKLEVEQQQIKKDLRESNLRIERIQSNFEKLNSPQKEISESRLLEKSKSYINDEVSLMIQNIRQQLRGEFEEKLQQKTDSLRSFYEKQLKHTVKSLSSQISHLNANMQGLQSENAELRVLIGKMKCYHVYKQGE